MVTNQDIVNYLVEKIKRIDARFVTSTETEGYADLELDDAIVRVTLSHHLKFNFTVPEADSRIGRQEVYDKYAMSAANGFLRALRDKCKRVVVSVPVQKRNDPGIEVTQSSEASVHLAVSSLQQRNGDVTFGIECKFGTFNV